MADTKHMRLGDILIQAGVLTESTLNAALKEQKVSSMRLGEILVKNGWVSEKHLAEALSRQLKVPLVSLARYKPTPEVLKVVPESMARRLEVVPLSLLDNGKLLVATADPLNVVALDELKMVTGREIELSIAMVSEIRRAFEQFYRVHTTLEEAMVEVMEDKPADSSLNLVDVGVDDAPVVKLVNSIMEEAVKEGTSDIHIEVFERGARVRYRIDGALFDSLEYPKNLHPAVCSRIKIMSGMDISERRRPQDGRILLKVGNKRVDLRVSSLPSIFGEKIVMRLLDQDKAMVGLERLGFSPDERALLEDMASLPYGIILVTGPTGSGKSTTLYSLLEVMNTPDVNIITVEDPVEYTMPGITQVQVNEKAGLTFSETLRSILRQDPDKIMIGEIRDQETAQLAIRAALTGHLVLSTLHTNDAPSAVARLLDMGIQPFMVSSAVVGVVAQRLARRLCSSCKKEMQLPDAVARSLDLPPGTRVFAPVGCDDCRNTGYKGRTALFEILLVDEEIKRAIAEGAPVYEIRKLAISKGMTTLRKAGIKKVLDGITSVEEMMSETMQ
ncbi:LOW QUALITY PROTEIN: type II secretory pathway, ATPase PulE/Tfp pilus assembly pathway, ATPase PilB [Thermanaerovibrio velox DSM 12556]|uniref:Type II secretory pathway, ATPase PulE/Tfp pilus assembly pathway, ATPase PilB n=1 Tax=Thermanaerovibrio velox DSM 12556 TaxID=926567 RepID=H0URD8_9BACT|nr:LOW QUALITY PROTEIN: type II secretory pathway, ATPase PulE/Tfp pilus assembly pathway, ATPase PilB [Thermanaerovibrio velox DSM 12556]